MIYYNFIVLNIIFYMSGNIFYIYDVDIGLVVEDIFVLETDGSIAC